MKPEQNRFLILRFLVQHQKTHGYMPSQAECATAFGWSQPYIAKELRILEYLGYVRRGSKPRDLAVLRVPSERRIA